MSDHVRIGLRSLCRRSCAKRFSRWRKNDFICDDYSIADIATWPWISRFEWQEIDMNAFPNVMRWYLTVLDRPAVQRGYQVPKDTGPIPRP